MLESLGGGGSHPKWALKKDEDSSAVEAPSWMSKDGLYKSANCHRYSDL